MDNYRNGYEFPFTSNEMIGHNTLSEIIEVSSKIFTNVIDTNSERWSGAIDLPLYMHQRATVKAMLDRENSLRQGIMCEDSDIFFSQYAFLGDDVSTGKTWSALAFIEAAKTVIKPSSLYLNQRSQINCWSFKAQIPAADARQTNIVICPLNVCNAWADLLSRQSQLTYIVVRRKNFITSDDIIERIEAADVVIVPNTLYGELNQRLLQEQFTWTRAFIDDWTGIPITQTRATINAQFTWILTSAWYHFLFENNYHNIWYWQRLISMVPPEANTNMLSFLRRIVDQPRDLFASPGSRSLFSCFTTNHPYRHHLIVRSDEEFIKTSINVKEPEIIEVPYIGDKVMQFLYSLAGRGVRQHLDAGHYERALELIGARFLTTNAWAENKSQILRRSEEEDDCCPICFEMPTIPVLTNCCQKFFCTGCLFRCCQAAGNQQCPTCRGHLHGQLLHVIYDSSLAEPAHPLKVEALIETLKATPTFQTLIYFPAEPFYSLLRNQLRAAELNFDVLTGGRDIIKRKLDRFKEGKIDILIFFNRNQVINADFSHVNQLVFYPDDIAQTDKTRIIVKTQCIGRSNRLKIIQFKNMDLAIHDS